MSLNHHLLLHSCIRSARNCYFFPYNIRNIINIKGPIAIYEWTHKYGSEWKNCTLCIISTHKCLLAFESKSLLTDPVHTSTQKLWKTLFPEYGCCQVRKKKWRKMVICNKLQRFVIFYKRTALTCFITFNDK